jgi:tungstate transport system ATP-binding protein
MNQDNIQSVMLEARNLSVVYGSSKVLDIPSIRIPPKRTTAIIGPNGSGKTTLSLCLALLLKPTSGQILFQGHIVPDRASIMQTRRHFAVVFQEPLLLNTSVWDNVTLGLQLRGVKHKEALERTQHWLERFGIAHLARRNAKTLSGGEAQRASLARAFVLQPEVLFLDEPFAALDVPTRQSLFGDMINILQETQCTTVMVTHDRNEAQTLAHNIVILVNGQVVQEGPPKELFNAPVNEEVAKFVGMENILEGTVVENEGGIVHIKIDERSIDAVSQCQACREVNVFIRPEDVTISLEQAPTSARNVFAGQIKAMIPSGPLVRVNLDCGFPLIALITRMSCDNLGLENGKTVYASFKATAIHVIAAK